eukprot:UN27021
MTNVYRNMNEEDKPAVIDAQSVFGSDFFQKHLREMHKSRMPHAFVQARDWDYVSVKVSSSQDPKPNSVVGVFYSIQGLDITQEIEPKRRELQDCDTQLSSCNGNGTALTGPVDGSCSCACNA